MALFQPYIDKARQEKKNLVDTLYKKIQLCKHQCDTYYLCIIFKNSGPHYVIATGQPTKTYPTLTLFAITLENPHFYYTKKNVKNYSQINWINWANKKHTSQILFLNFRKEPT